MRGFLPNNFTNGCSGQKGKDYKSQSIPHTQHPNLLLLNIAFHI